MEKYHKAGKQGWGLDFQTNAVSGQFPSDPKIQYKYLAPCLRRKKHLFWASNWVLLATLWHSPGPELSSDIIKLSAWDSIWPSRACGPRHKQARPERDSRAMDQPQGGHQRRASMRTWHLSQNLNDKAETAT